MAALVTMATLDLTLLADRANQELMLAAAIVPDQFECFQFHQFILFLTIRDRTH
jgi:hypothetical protein